MTILVTGATGFIGKKVVLQLAKRNLSIVAADLDLDPGADLLDDRAVEGTDLELLIGFTLLPFGRAGSVVILLGRLLGGRRDSKFDSILIGQRSNYI